MFGRNEDMEAAVREVVSRGCSIRSAARKYSLSKSTLARQIATDPSKYNVTTHPEERSLTTVAGYQCKSVNVIWKHPFTCIVAGPSGCGKTALSYASCNIFPAWLILNSATSIGTTQNGKMPMLQFLHLWNFVKDYQIQKIFNRTMDLISLSSMIRCEKLMLTS